MQQWFRLLLLRHFSPISFMLCCSSLRCSHQQVEGESNNEQQAERRVEGLVGRRRHEDVLILVDAYHAVTDWRAVDVVSRDGSCYKRSVLA